jgi:type VI secretion system secreted protein Hcp
MGLNVKPGGAVSILLVIGFCLVASAAYANVTDLFIKFDDIKGGSTESNHKDWSDILSVKWGVSAKAPPPGGGTTSPTFKDLTWTQVEDKSSVPLFGKMGSFIDKAYVDFASPGGGSGDRVYFQMEFGGVYLTELDVIGETSALTTVSGAFAYDFIRLTYTPYDENGTPQAPLIAEYDLAANEGSLGALVSLYALGLSGPMTVPAVPVPASLWLFGSGLVGLTGLRGRLKR